MRKNKIEKYLNIFIMVICTLLGITIATWTTTVQADFLDTLGVSKLGALTVEPLLVVASFLLGVKITRAHRNVAMTFLVILFGISLTMMTSMYAKKSYVAIEKSSINESLSKRSTNSEDIIAKTIEKLGNREEVSSKNIVKTIDQLQKQQERTEKKVVSETLELESIIEVIASLMRIEKKTAILIFSFFISLAAVFSPSFLFFSAGMMIQSAGIFDVSEDYSKKMDGLSLKQKVIEMTKDHGITDPKEMAKFLGTSERVVKSQMSRIKNKREENGNV